MPKKKSDATPYAEGKAAFAGTVCKRCQLCEPMSGISPDFCMIVYEGDETRFLGFINHVHKLQKSKPTYKLESFEAFCGLFCNSFPLCPNKSDKCSELKTRVACYTYFVKQWHSPASRLIPQGVLAEIYNLYSGCDLDDVGNYLSFDLRKLRKEEKKAIRALRLGKRAVQAIGITAIKISNRRKQDAKSYGKKPARVEKQVNTSVFYNDDPVWICKVRELLSKKENYDDEADD